MIKQFLLIVSLLLFSACGYQLRGTLDLPAGVKTVYIKGASNRLRNNLKTSLRFSDATLVSNPQGAGLVIEVLKEKMRRNVLSLNSSGRANEYELDYVLDFLLLNANGEPLTKPQSVEVTRDYFNDEEQLLGKENEEQVIRKEIYLQAVRSLLNQSRVALKKNLK